MFSQETKLYLFTAAGISLLLFTIFKHFYPYPNMVMDSYVYLNAAVHHWGANSYPIGYSKFLEWFLHFSNSAGLLVWIQYLLLECSCGLLFLTVAYFLKPSKLIQCVLLAFLFCNPLWMFSSNFIMSDVLYTAISLFWIAQLIWIIGRPRPFLIWTNALLLLLAYAIRYNALYYPVLSSIIILVSALKPRIKVAGIVLEVVFIGLFVQYTRIETKALTGIEQFSPLGGWHLANNALYTYSHIYQKSKDPLPDKFLQLDSVVRNYYDHTKYNVEVLEFDDRNGFGGFYLDNRTSPLYRYMYWKDGYDTIFTNFRKWGPMGQLCAAYGAYLIRQHPASYFHYYVLPNTIRYLWPPSEVFSTYSPFFLRSDEFGKMAVQSFHLKTLTVSAGLINFRTSILSYFPTMFGLLNLFLVLGVIGFLLFRGPKNTCRTNLYILSTIAALFLCNFLFSITSASIVFRYQLFMLIVLFVFDVLLLEMVYHLNISPKPVILFP